MSKQKKIPSLIHYYNDELPESMEFRRLYLKLHSFHPNGDMKKILVTSAVKGEGKSTIATFLAITIAKYWETNTLLIDCDVRRPKIHKYVGFEDEVIGLVDILKGNRSIEECIKNTPIDNLNVLTSGYLQDNPVELLKSSKIKNILDELKFYYDTIILDTAPVIPVSDALIMSSEADIVLLVIRAGKTQEEVLKRATSLIKDAGVKTMGALLNNVDQVLPYYYDYKYYGYEYYNNK